MLLILKKKKIMNDFVKVISWINPNVQDFFLFFSLLHLQPKSDVHIFL